MIDYRWSPGPQWKRLPAWVVVSLIVVVAPIGPVLMWRSTDWRVGTKVLVTAVYFPPVGAWWVHHASIGSGRIRAGVWLAVIAWLALNVFLVIAVLS